MKIPFENEGGGGGIKYQILNTLQWIAIQMTM